MDYKFNEDKLIKELHDYVDSTYGQHYGQGKLQATEVIIDRGNGSGFCLGNIDKYLQRLGKKGSAEEHRKDYLKILHYTLLALYVHDEENSV